MSTREPNAAEVKAWVKFMNRPSLKRAERNVRTHGFTGRAMLELIRQWHIGHSRNCFMWGYDWSIHLAIAYGWKKP